MKLTEFEIAALAFLAGQQDGRGMICSPELSAGVRCLAYSIPGLVSDVYEMPGGGYTARITEAGRLALSQEGGRE